MRFTLLLILLVATKAGASDDEHIKLIEGMWKCPIDIQLDHLRMRGESIDTYDAVNMRYYSEAIITFIYGDRHPIAKIKATDLGVWQYYEQNLLGESAKVKIEVLFDYDGLFSDETIEYMRMEILNDSMPVLTLDIDQSNWQLFDPETREEFSCSKTRLVSDTSKANQA